MSAQQLADRCAQLGFPLHRSVIANLENGRRPTVSVAELLVLAEALGVPAARLLIPLDNGDVETLPGRPVNPWTALRSFTGDNTPEMELLRRHDKAAADLAAYLTDLERGRRDGRQLSLDNFLVTATRASYRELNEIQRQMTDRGLTLPELPSWLEKFVSSGTLGSAISGDAR